jgi:hypothetical protein
VKCTFAASGWRAVRAGPALVFVLMLIAGLGLHGPAAGQDASTLRARHAALHDRLANNQFGRPLALESTQTAGDLRGDVYVVVDHAFGTVQQALQSLDNWCDILILHLNVKRCKVGDGGKVLTLSVGRKFDQPIEDAYELEFAYRVASTKADYLQVQLTAPEGPLSTKNYRIQVEATPVEPRRTVIHMSYAYGYGFAARMAMQTYLATIGREKVGFTITGQKPDGRPMYIGGVLGLLERNTMRYYLAIDAYLAAYGMPPAEQVERRMREWYGSTERYAPQLREMEQAEYLEMKRKEIRRQKQG